MSKPKTRQDQNRANRRASEAASRKKAREKAAANHAASAQSGAPTSPDDLLDTHAAAQVLGTSPHTLDVWRYTKRYPLEYIKVGRRVRYRRSALTKFLDARTVVAQTEAA